MIGMSERVNSDGITAESEWTDAPEWATSEGSGWDRASNWYSVTLHHGRRRMTVPFGMGSGLTGEPTAEDVINCLVSDASGYENARDFEDWASEYGYDTDSRRAYQTYQQVERQTAKLKTFLGDEYEAYLWDTEGL